MKPIRLELEFRCNQNWNDMKEHEGGKVCSQCSSHVTDFSVMSDSEIITHLKKNA